MGQLHDRMAQDLVLRNLSPATRRNYLLYCRKFAAFCRCSPAELGEADIRKFLVHCIEVQRLSYAAYRQIYAALKFLYTVTLQRPWEVGRLPCPKNRVRPLPVILHADELQALFAAFICPKFRALFMSCYAAGLRINEACHLQVADLDSKRMLIHVRRAAGRVALPRRHRRRTGLRRLRPSGVRPRPPRRRHLQALYAAHAPAQLCYPPARCRRRPRAPAEAPGARVHPHHQSLHAGQHRAPPSRCQPPRPVARPQGPTGERG